MKRLVTVAICLLAPLGCAGSSQEGPRAASPAEERGAVSEGGGAMSPQEGVPPEKLDELNEFFYKKRASLQFDCYDAEAEKTGKKYEGNVSLSMLVRPGGKATDVKIVSSTLKSPAIETCLVDSVQRWEWPDVPSPAVYTGSINFKPAW